MTLKLNGTQVNVLLIALELLQDDGNNSDDVLKEGMDLSDEIYHLIDLENLANTNAGRA